MIPGTQPPEPHPLDGNNLFWSVLEDGAGNKTYDSLRYSNVHLVCLFQLKPYHTVKSKMQSVQRRFGKQRTADESQVAVLLKDFEDADKMLSRVCSP